MPGLFAAPPVIFAQAAAPAGGAGANGSPSLVTFLPYVIIIVLYFYLIVIRPQQKQEQRRKEMIAGIKKNDKVLTTAGMYGTVVSVDEKDDRVVVRIGDGAGLRVEFTKASIVRVGDGSERKEKEKEKDKDKVKDAGVA